MISIIKKDKPAILVLHEEEWTDELMSFVNKGEEIPKGIGGRYRHSEIKETLLEETGHKCAYCESKITHIDFGDIEHIIPKSVFRDKTFQWENLTIGCTKCNNNKKHYYNPIMPLLNPYLDNPEQKIIFIGPLPFPIKGDKVADFTIKKLKLNRPELIERRTEHLQKLGPLVMEYERTEDPELRSLLLDDLLKTTSYDKEYALMTKYALDELKITG
ncbi:CRISPR-associated endonuclease Cas9 [compost metagenome]